SQSSSFDKNDSYDDYDNKSTATPYMTASQARAKFPLADEVANASYEEACAVIQVLVRNWNKIGDDNHKFTVGYTQTGHVIIGKKMFEKMYDLMATQMISVRKEMEEEEKREHERERLERIREREEADQRQAILFENMTGRILTQL